MRPNSRLLYATLLICAYVVGVNWFLRQGVGPQPAADSWLASLFAFGMSFYALGFAVAVVLAPFQFKRNLPQWLAKTYLLAGVLLGGIGAINLWPYFLLVSPIVFLGCVLHTVLWLGTAYVFWRNLVNGDALLRQHALLFNSALSYACITMAVWAVWVLVLNAKFEHAFPILAWLSWVPNLLWAERRYRQHAATVQAENSMSNKTSLTPAEQNMRIAQIEAVLYGNLYDWALKAGVIQQGETFSYQTHLKISKADVIDYLKTHPIPGIDTQVAAYRDIRSEGPTWSCENGTYTIGWLERGVFTVDSSTNDEAKFRSRWVEFLLAAKGYLN